MNRLNRVATILGVVLGVAGVVVAYAAVPGFATYARYYLSGKSALVLLRHNYHGYNNMDLRYRDGAELKILREPLTEGEVVDGIVAEAGKEHPGIIVDTSLPNGWDFHAELYKTRDGVTADYYAGRLHIELRDDKGNLIFDSPWQDVFVKKG